MLPRSENAHDRYRIDEKAKVEHRRAKITLDQRQIAISRQNAATQMRTLYAAKSHQQEQSKSHNHPLPELSLQHEQQQQSENQEPQAQAHYFQRQQHNMPLQHQTNQQPELSNGLRTSAKASNTHGTAITAATATAESATTTAATPTDFLTLYATLQSKFRTTS